MIRRIALALITTALIASAQHSGVPGQEFKLVLAGDANLHRHLSVYHDPAYVELFNRIRAADARFVNFETLIHNYEYAASPFSGGINSYSPAWITDEIKWAGFNLLSVAQNHAFDWGPEGLRSTLRHLDAANLVHAGAGENLALARSPSYLDTDKGRVALVAAASTLNPESPASEQRRDLRGRFGVNPLRYTTTYTVDQTTLDALRKLQPRESGWFRTVKPAGAKALNLGAQKFEVGEKFGSYTTANPADLDGLLTAVRQARRQADWVVISLHAHESKGPAQPADFVKAFAHAAVDAGADVIAIHGPHDAFRGIEIYKGKPIFYSLGNFAFDGDTQPFLPSERYDAYGVPQSGNNADIFDVITEKETGGLLKDKLNFQSAIAELKFNGDGKLTSIVLDPITLGQTESRAQRGRPRPASASEAAEIIDRIAKLSAPLGTTVRFENGRGVVTVQ